VLKLKLAFQLRIGKDNIGPCASFISVGIKASNLSQFVSEPTKPYLKQPDAGNLQVRFDDEEVKTALW